jgi:hypothetical protein
MDRTADVVPGLLRPPKTVDDLELARIIGLKVLARAYAESMQRTMTDQHAVALVAMTYRLVPPTMRQLEPALALLQEWYMANRDDECLVLSRLVLQAAEAGGLAPGSPNHRKVALGYVFVGRALLSRLPVGPLFRAITEITDGWVAAGVGDDWGDGAPASPQARVWTLQMAIEARQCLWLNERTVAWWSRDGDWLQMLRGKIDSAVLNGTPDVLRLPDACEQMAIALGHARTAARMVQGPERADFLIQAATIERAMDEHAPSTDDELRASIREAVDLLLPSDRPAHELVWARQLLDHLGGTTDADRARAVHGRPLMDALAHGVEFMIAEFTASAWLALRLGRFNEAVELSREFLLLDVLDATWQSRAHGLDVAIHCGDAGAVDCRTADDAALAGTSDSIMALLPIDSAGRADRAAALHLALHSPWRVFERILGTPSAPASMDPLFDGVLTTYIRARAMERAMADGDYDPRSRIHCGLESLRFYSVLWAEHMAAQIGRSLAILLESHPEFVPGALVHLDEFIGPLLARFGDETVDMLHHLGQATAGAVRAVDGAAGDILLLHSTLFKGLRTSATIEHSGPLSPPDLGSLSASIVELEGEVDTVQANHVGSSVIDRDLLALAYSTGSENLAGSRPADRLRNLRQIAGKQIEEKLYGERLPPRRRRLTEGADDAVRAKWHQFNAALDERTIFLDLYDGQLPDGRFTTFLASYTPDGGWLRHVRVGDMARGTAVLQDPGEPGRIVRFHEHADRLANLRRMITQDPGRRRPVVREAIGELKDTPAALIGPSMEHYYSGSGYDRLCVWPHSIHHYSPIQVMESGPGRVLADDWLVTVVPTVECLIASARRAREPSVVGRIGLLAAASPTGGRSAGYPDVQILADQARRLVRRSPGALLLRPGRVTTADLARLMPVSRYVHLAAHGEADPYAPLWQCLYLDGEGPGSRLTAAAILTMDLRGVEVVTLAACESALGRFDEADTQKGLTAALLAAGVTAVVACLWPVRPEPAVLFFDRFYEWLGQDGSDLRAAFGAAQTATRARFPAYRDWGVFTYIGGW